MSKIVLLAMAAAWAAVLIPPLFRSRVDNRPNSSISDFRRHLTTLQRTVPTRQVAPMRAMARPLTHSAHQRSSAHVQPGSRGMAQHAVERPTRTVRQHGPRDDARSFAPRQHSRERIERQAARRRPAPVVSQREQLRRRRLNVLLMLLVTTGVTLFLAATSKSTAMLYVFAISFVVLGGYCYKLVQVRAAERNEDAEHWYRTA